jgi:DNA polymerase III epsilon subunit-like protein
MGNRLYLDLETTHLSHTGSIVEIAAEYYIDDKLVASFNDKGFDETAIVSLDALKVNKHTFASLKQLRSEKDLLLYFVDWLLTLKGSPEMAGVNIQFDYNFLKTRAQKYNIDIGSVLPYRLHDITNISRFLSSIGLLQVKNSGKGNSLKDLADTLKIEYKEEELHSAKGDVSLYFKIDKKLTELAVQAMCKCKV